MLKSFQVRNFRCLEDFQIDNLVRVNLIVGDNNAGKTTLLEALYLHRYHMGIDRPKLRVQRPSQGDDWWLDLFSFMDRSKEIRLVSANSAGTEEVSTIPFSDPPSQMSVKRNFRADDPIFYFQPWTLPAFDSIARHLSQAEIDKQKDSLVQVARAIDPRVQGITLVSPNGTTEVFVDLGGVRLLPLASMGSAMVRVMAIASAMTNCIGGLLLVDEIDDGIHYRRLGELWMGLDRMSKAFNVQIIATTHSGECVNAAIENISPCEGDSDPLHVYRIDRGKKLPMPYEVDALKAVTAFGAEVR